MTKRMLGVLAGVVIIGASAAAQQKSMPATGATKTTAGDAAKIRQATSAAPADIGKGAAVIDIDAKGTTKQLRAGTNGWTCMLMAVGEGATEAMCGDKEWSGWGDAYMAKKAPATKNVGVAYMLHGDNGASNTDPFATGPTATNDWVVSPAHLMLLVPDSKLLDGFPADPHAGGPFVMWKGTPYAHLMVPLTSMPASKPMAMPMKKK